MRIPKRMRAWRKASSMPDTTRCRRRYPTPAAVRRVTCTPWCRESSSRRKCETPAFFPFGGLPTFPRFRFRNLRMSCAFFMVNIFWQIFVNMQLELWKRVIQDLVLLGLPVLLHRVDVHTLDRPIIPAQPPKATIDHFKLIFSVDDQNRSRSKSVIFESHFECLGQFRVRDREPQTIETDLSRPIQRNVGQNRMNENLSLLCRSIGLFYDL